ncbi:MAG: 3-hydroxyacyl-CoA dehydrogenase family protein [Syntrophobacterales bacterium]|nr:MAG: 3-hydroxyacyl-CoA dehydrogenase family protein [Syntrophobacterales bacterium]
MDIKKIGVVGSGVMGSGIAQLAAQSGCTVVMQDVADEFVKNGLGSIEKFLAKGIERGKVTEGQKNEVLSRIRGTTRIEDLKDANFIIEAVFEDLKVKQEVFEKIDGLVAPEVILCTNTSSISITEIASATKRPHKVAGMHFFNPAQLMKLVEVIRGYHTSDETIGTVIDLAKRMNKEPVEVKNDSPGFIVNRIMMPHFIEAIRIVEEGIATVEDVDKAVKLGLNYPMGPFELMDLTGNDIAHHVIEYLHNELNKELKWSPPNLLKTLIRGGRLGRKTGGGWYDY